MRITTLSENTAGRVDLLAEWGLSFLIETGETRILFDTGNSLSAVYNADRLGVDLARVDMIVLSHGHVDHTGGLRDVLRRMKKQVPVIAHPDVWEPKYRRLQGQNDRYNGIPFQRRELEYLGAVFNLTREPVTIADGIITTGEIPMTNDFEKVLDTLLVKDESGPRPDEVMDDLALIITTEAGLVVVLGCAHRGMINTLHHARQITGVETIYAVVGGAHLIDTTEERVWLTIAALKDMDVPRLGLCHCTGMAAASLLAAEFGERFFFNPAGTITELP